MREGDESWTEETLCVGNAGKVLKDYSGGTIVNIVRDSADTKRHIAKSIRIGLINYGYMSKAFLILQWHYIGTARKVVR